MSKAKGRPKKPTGEGVTVRIDSDIVSKGRYLASLRDIPLSEYLSDVLRPVVDRDFAAVGRSLFKGEGGK